MITVFFKKKPGSTEPRKEIKEIFPDAIEQGTFYYNDKYDSLREVDQRMVDQFKTDSKAKAVEILNIFKPTHRYIAIVQSGPDYYVELDDCPMLRVGERLVREVNVENIEVK